MLLIFKKCIRGGICHAVHRYAKANNEYINDYDPNTESSYFIYWGVNNLYQQVMQQKLPVDDFRWKKKKSKFTQKFMQSYDDESGKGYILLMLVIPSVYKRYTVIFIFA